MGKAIGDTLRHAMFLARHLSNCNAKSVTVAVLLDMGVPAKRIGFEYLIHAILRFYEDPAQALTKELYPDIARLYGPGADERQVEAAIRAVITEAWNNRNPKVWVCYYPHQAGRKMKKPTNMEFISEIARFLELWRGCCERTMYEKL